MTRASILAASAALAVPAAAQAAPTLEQLQPCYVSVRHNQRQALETIATGFTPNAGVDVIVGNVTKRAVASGGGTVDLRRWSAPYRRHGQRPFRVSVTERGNPFNTVSATSYVTALSVRLRPREAATSDRVRFRGRGFTSAAPIWAHYLNPRGHLRKTVRLADGPKGVCGTFSVRRRQIPVRHPRAGRWTLQVDQQHHFSPDPYSVWKRVTITVHRMIGG